jgi:hypothetical protein
LRSVERHKCASRREEGSEKQGRQRWIWHKYASATAHQPKRDRTRATVHGMLLKSRSFRAVHSSRIMHEKETAAAYRFSVCIYRAQNELRKSPDAGGLPRRTANLPIFWEV